jgi:tubby and related proteins
MRPLPRGAGIVQCHIVRNKSGTNKLFPIYSLYLKENDRFLMCSKKRANNKTSNYIISKGEHDLSRESPNYLGKLRSNFVGTEFQVYDNGASPDSEESARGAEIRRELGAVMYAPNVLGSRGPRKMQVCVPCVDESNAIVTWRQQRVSGCGRLAFMLCPMQNIVHENTYNILY